MQKGEAPDVKTAASLFRKICYNYKDQVQAGIIVAGWDKYKGGSVYNISMGGSLHQQPFAIGGEQLLHAISIIQLLLIRIGIHLHLWIL
jgi:20S proteasome subunit beta 1